MECGAWSLQSKEGPEEKRFGRDALFTVGNGYVGIRGFYEEDTKTLGKNGGIYMAGVFGAGTYDAWEGRSRELVNVPNFLRVCIEADGERLNGICGVNGLCRTLDMDTGTYRRTYAWTGGQGAALSASFERFADKSDCHRVGQRIALAARETPVRVSVSLLLDSDVVNLNRESCEPLPVQPGRDHVLERQAGADRLQVRLDGEDGTRLHFAQCVRAYRNGCTIDTRLAIGDKETGRCLECTLEPGESLVLERLVYIAGTPQDDKEAAARAQAFPLDAPPYEEAYRAHSAAWAAAWRDADVAIESDTQDAGILRYNLFQLQCACPPHTDRLGIGARGLTGEMYEGCVFWDNEIFQLPFFTFTDPKAARRQLLFRYHTLDAARRQAAVNWFEGAMIPWQMSEKGIEQTPVNGGAFYAIHITADVAYAIRQYLRVSGDESFLPDGGADILFETARFWASRCEGREDGSFEIRAVRGPNEYDVFVNNNAYTNAMARENLRTAVTAWKWMRVNAPERLRPPEKEMERWARVEEGLRLPVCRELDLIEEDDAYRYRRPLDLARAKPTGRRIIDSTMPYEALPLYQVTKQSDVVTLLCLLPEAFTEAQKETAYRYYEPRTAHDSSLSYAPHAWLAARLGMREEAYRYFQRSATLDVMDRQLNTVSGLHFANLGGTWQAVFFGFAGVAVTNDGVEIRPQLPDAWKSLRLCFYYRGNRLSLVVANDRVEASLNQNASGAVRATVFGTACILDAARPDAVWNKPRGEVGV